MGSQRVGHDWVNTANGPEAVWVGVGVSGAGSQEDSRPGEIPASLEVEQETEENKRWGELPGMPAEGAGEEVVGPACAGGEGREEGLAGQRAHKRPWSRPPRRDGGQPRF